MASPGDVKGFNLKNHQELKNFKKSLLKSSNSNDFQVKSKKKLMFSLVLWANHTFW